MKEKKREKRKVEFLDITFHNSAVVFGLSIFMLNRHDYWMVFHVLPKCDEANDNTFKDFTAGYDQLTVVFQVLVFVWQYHFRYNFRTKNSIMIYNPAFLPFYLPNSNFPDPEIPWPRFAWAELSAQATLITASLSQSLIRTPESQRPWIEFPLFVSWENLSRVSSPVLPWPTSLYRAPLLHLFPTNLK